MKMEKIYSPDNYGELEPGTTVVDAAFGASWDVLSNSGGRAVLREHKAGEKGAMMDVTAEDTRLVFIMRPAGNKRKEAAS